MKVNKVGVKYATVVVRNYWSVMIGEDSCGPVPVVRVKCQERNLLDNTPTLLNPTNWICKCVMPFSPKNVGPTTLFFFLFYVFL